MRLVESERVELKRTVTDRLCRTIVAFANSMGGNIYIGFDDFGNALGVEDIDAEMLRATSLIHDDICPDLLQFVSVEPLEIDGVSVIRISVEPGDEKPYYLSSKGLVPAGVYTRVGPATVPLDRRGIRRMIRETDRDSFETRHAQVQNLSFDKAREIFRRHGVAFDEPQFKSLGLYASDGFYANLALLLSDQCPFTIKCAVFNDDCGAEFITRRECSGSVFGQLEQAADFLDASNRLRSSFQGLQRIDQRDYPEQAVREALVNAILHQDYDEGASPLIKMYSDRLEFTSFGGMVGPLSLEDALAGASMSRNPGLTAIFHRLGIVEAFGTGLPAIQRLYREKDLRAGFSASGIFKVTLPNVNTAGDPTKTLTENYGRSERFGDDVQPRRRPDGDNARPCDSETELAFSWDSGSRLLLEFASSRDSFSRPEAQQVLGMGRDTALKVINGLVDEGKLERVGKARATRYRLASRG